MLLAKMEALRAKVSSRSTVATGVILVLAMSFISMVTSSYTADHIKGASSCKVSTDTKLKSAYNLSMISAIFSALLCLTMGLVLVGVIKL